VCFEQSVDRGNVLDVEDGLDRGPLSPGAHDIDRSALSQKERQCTHDDRLSGAGFTGESVEPGAELEREILYDGVVTDAEFDEHGRESRGADPGATMGGWAGGPRRIELRPLRWRDGPVELPSHRGEEGLPWQTNEAERPRLSRHDHLVAGS